MSDSVIVLRQLLRASGMRIEGLTHRLAQAEAREKRLREFRDTVLGLADKFGNAKEFFDNLTANDWVALREETKTALATFAAKIREAALAAKGAEGGGGRE